MTCWPATVDDDKVDFRPLLAPLARVQRQTPVTELLRRMLDERRHMVLVADERGRTVGLLTLEDLVEELVGEIETDAEPSRPGPSRQRVASRGVLPMCTQPADKVSRRFGRS